MGQHRARSDLQPQRGSSSSRGLAPLLAELRTCRGVGVRPRLDQAMSGVWREPNARRRTVTPGPCGSASALGAVVLVIGRRHVERAERCPVGRSRAVSRERYLHAKQGAPVSRPAVATANADRQLLGQRAAVTVPSLARADTVPSCRPTPRWRRGASVRCRRLRTAPPITERPPRASGPECCSRTKPVTRPAARPA